MHFLESQGGVAHLAFVVMFIVLNLNSQITYIMQFSTMHLLDTVYGFLHTPGPFL